MVGTAGAEFHPTLDTAPVEAVHQGRARGRVLRLRGAAARRRPASADWLRARGVDAVDVVGIATDHCVRATALDAVREGFATTVLLDLTAGVAPATLDVALGAMDGAQVTMVGEPVIRTARPGNRLRLSYPRSRMAPEVRTVVN